MMPPLTGLGNDVCYGGFYSDVAPNGACYRNYIHAATTMSRLWRSELPSPVRGGIVIESIARK